MLFNYNSFGKITKKYRTDIIAENVYSEINIKQKNNNFEIENRLAGIDSIVTNRCYRS